MMTDPAATETAESTPNADTVIAGLRAAGAEGFDPVRLRYIDALARRAGTLQGAARQLLDAKLTLALNQFSERFERMQQEAAECAAQCTRQYPHAARDLQRLMATGDFKGVQRLAASLQAGERRTPLAALVRELEQHAQPGGNAQTLPHTGPLPELKTVQKFRSTWSRLSVDKQVSRALEQAPKNAGPINSHMLVLRSLALMRDISPDYLNRFISYADTLLSLDPGEKEKPVAPKKPQRASKK